MTFSSYDGEKLRARRSARFFLPAFFRLQIACDKANGLGPNNPLLSRVARRDVFSPCPRSRRFGVLWPADPIARSAVPGRRDSDIALPVALRKDGKLLGQWDRLPPGGPPLLRQANLAPRELRRAGSHRDGERAANHRDPRSVRTADCNRRGPAGYQLLAWRPRPGVQRDAGKSHPTLRGPGRGLSGSGRASDSEPRIYVEACLGPTRNFASPASPMEAGVPGPLWHKSQSTQQTAMHRLDHTKRKTRDAYREGDPFAVAVADRSSAGIAQHDRHARSRQRRRDAGLAVSLYRHEVRPFSEKRLHSWRTLLRTRSSQWRTRG